MQKESTRKWIKSVCTLKCKECPKCKYGSNAIFLNVWKNYSMFILKRLARAPHFNLDAIALTLWEQLVQIWEFFLRVCLSFSRSLSCVCVCMRCEWMCKFTMNTLLYVVWQKLFLWHLYVAICLKNSIHFFSLLFTLLTYNSIVLFCAWYMRYICFSECFEF